MEQYIAIGDYTKEKKNECSLKAGQAVEVIEKNENGLKLFVVVRVCHIVFNAQGGGLLMSTIVMKAGCLLHS